MRIASRVISALLSAVILLGSICSCSLVETLKENNRTPSDRVHTVIDELDRVSSKTAPAPEIPEYSGRNTMNVAIDTELSFVSPFFAQSEAELTAARLAFARLVNTERGGSPVMQGISGQSSEYQGTEYSYYGLADVSITQNENGTADYSFTLREDAFFSDGTNITADDVVFSMYVLLDPSYIGYSDLGSLPVTGLDEYRESMISLADRIYYTDGDEVGSIAASDVRRFRETMVSVQQTYADGVLSRIREEYSADYLGGYAGKWTDKVEDDTYMCAIGMVLLGYAEWQTDEEGNYTGVLVTDGGAEFDCTEEFPSYDDLFLSAAKSTDSLLSVDEKIPEGDLEGVLREAFGDEYHAFFEVKRVFESKTESISGIKKTGMYSLTVQLGRYDPSDIYAFSFFVAPLHIYGSREAYKYTESRFGFSRGDLGQMRAVSAKVSSGAYCYRGEKDGAYRFERNKFYYLGCPYLRYIDLRQTDPDEDVVLAIAEGKYDVASRALDERTVLGLDSVNRDEEKVVSMTYAEGACGCIGIQRDTVSVAGDPSSEASVSLRRALCVLLSLYSDIASENYLPKGYTAAAVGGSLLPSAVQVYSQNIHGDEIYTADMTAKQKKTAAAEAALEYLVSAGYTVNEAGTRVVSAPEGGMTEIELLLLGDGPCSDYIIEAVKNTADALDGIGIKLRVRYAEGVRDLERRLAESDVQIWAYERSHGTYTDSDGYEQGTEIPIYYKNSVTLSAVYVHGINDASDSYGWCDAVHTMTLPQIQNGGETNDGI